MIESATLSTATAILSYMHPSKSPFYGVVAADSFASIIACSKELGSLLHWLAVSIPIFSVLALSLLFSFSIKPNFEQFEQFEHLDSLRFCRSIVISTGLLALALTARESDTNNVAFLLCYFSCIMQIFTFIAYAYARSKKDESDEKTYQ